MRKIGTITLGIIGAAIVFALCALGNVPAVVTCLACSSIVAVSAID